ncbi:unnamed protein product [Linum trigynum]|uniref:Uncharacterized protein n=1 Tax=Linum trigynum TaxID=586398 RepID=A0AAV2D9L1_9ROSI
MDPHDFNNHWGYPPPSEWYYPETPWSNQGGEDYGFRFRYQPPYYVEQSNPWAYQEQTHYQEEFLPQLEGPSELELPMAAFTGHYAERERVQKEVVEDDESEAEGVLDHFPGVIPHEEGREVEEAIGVKAEDEVEVEEACTGH